MKANHKFDEVQFDNSSSKDKLIAGLCDDELYAHDSIAKILADYSHQRGVDIEILDYSSAKELLEAGNEMDFLLLDIDMPEMDGIEAGHKLRSKGASYKIIMLTARDDRFREAFKIGAFRFVSKPFESKDIFEAVDDVRENMSAFQKVQVYRDGVQYNIVQRDILYVEANHSSTLIFTATNEFRSELPLSVWKDALDGKAFFQCHKSFIVNMGKIESIQGNTVIMVGGDKVSVSRRLHNEFMRAYMEYDTKWR